jgi:hypothetical protein
MIETEARVSSLEQVLEEFIRQTNFSINNMIEEMADFKEEMKEFKEEMRRQSEQMNKKWGELANKMGTLVEDIIAPGAPEALKKKFGIETIDMMVRRRYKDKNGNTEEFDIIIEGSDKKIYLIEVKSNPKLADIDEVLFKSQKLQKLLYPDFTIVSLLGSLYFPDTVIKYALKMKVYIMGMSGDYLEILN